MAGFTKLSGTLITSTIWQEDNETRILWITMLSMADMHGRVMATIPGLARSAGISICHCESSLSKLMSADRYSRSKTKEGRRIVEIDGGWKLINYRKYREYRDPIKRRAQNRLAQKLYRERQKSKPIISQGKPEKAQAEAEAEAEVEAKEVKEKDLSAKADDTVPKPPKYSKGFQAFWEAYPHNRRNAKGMCFGY